MSAHQSIFFPPAAVAPEPAVKTIRVITVVELEVLDQVWLSDTQHHDAPANGNHVIPFASTLRRLG